tara:strand:- start:581 stop:775 length:195 start_codon:yes stop_codon:yes gene_type:complete
MNKTINMIEALEYLDSKGILLVDKTRPYLLTNNGEVLVLNKVDKATICKMVAEEFKGGDDESQE